MRNLFISSLLLSLVVSPFANTTYAQSSTQAPQQTQPATTEPQSGSASKQVAVAAKPWKLTTEIHLEKGTNQGYLVVQVDLSEGHHIYSLSPEGSPAPTKLAVLPSNDLRVISKFASDKAPTVIEMDPVFERRIEKHKGSVKFFAPIKVRPGVDLAKLTQEVQFSGQVCSESGCQPIRNFKSNALFTGYFEIPKTGNNENAGQTNLK